MTAYMPVMLAVMEIPRLPGGAVLVARLRHKGMDALGNMPDEPDYKAPMRVGAQGGPPASSRATSR